MINFKPNTGYCFQNTYHVFWKQVTQKLKKNKRKIRRTHISCTRTLSKKSTSEPSLFLQQTLSSLSYSAMRDLGLLPKCLQDESPQRLVVFFLRESAFVSSLLLPCTHPRRPIFKSLIMADDLNIF